MTVMTRFLKDSSHLWRQLVSRGQLVCTVREGLVPVRRYQKVEVHHQQKVLVQVNSLSHTYTSFFCTLATKLTRADLKDVDTVTLNSLADDT